MLSDYNEEQFDVEREHHPCANLLKRFVEWKNLKIEVRSDRNVATVWFSSVSGGNLCIAHNDSPSDLITFLYHFHSISENDSEAKNELLKSEFLCKELLCSMAKRHFFIIKSNHSAEFAYDFTFPDSWQILEMQMTVAGF